MALGFQIKLNEFQFERTVDWRVRFSELHNIDSDLKNSFGDGYFFAKSVVIPTSLIEISDDPQLVGFFQSKLVQPTLSVEIFTDGNGKLENALRIWNRAAFSNEGYMPSPFSSDLSNYAKQAVQPVVVDRINPVNVEEVKKGINNSNGNLDHNVLERYTFQGYLARMPDYTGQNSASVRTVNLTIKVVSMQVQLKDDLLNKENSLDDASYKTDKNKDLNFDFYTELK